MNYSEFTRFKVEGIRKEMEQLVNGIIVLNKQFIENTRSPAKKTLKPKKTKTAVGKVFSASYQVPKDRKKTGGYKSREKGIALLQDKIDAEAHAHGDSSQSYNSSEDESQFKNLDMS